MYPSPIPFDSPCHHGPVSPTIKPSESFWNAQSSYFSLLPGHCACRKSALSMAALCRAGRVRRLRVQPDPHPAFEARCRTHPPCWKPQQRPCNAAPVAETAGARASPQWATWSRATHSEPAASRWSGCKANQEPPMGSPRAVGVSPSTWTSRSAESSQQPA